MQIETSIEILFEAISNLEKIKFEENIFYNQQENIKIVDENNECIDIVAMITKFDYICTMITKNGIEIKTAVNHKLSLDGGKSCVEVKDIQIGAEILINDIIDMIISKEIGKPEIVYDITVNSENHLFKTSNGVIHHNTHAVMTEILKVDLEEDVDYVVIKGYSTPKALYATLYEHKNKLIIFDDCDSVLMDPTSLNILKGALDSYQKRTISWLSKGFIDDGLPASFAFEGQVIFISNRTLEKIDGAVKGRTISVDLTMTIQDRIDRMTAIIVDILPQYDLTIKHEVLEFIDEHKYEAVELNLRTFEKLIKVHVSYEADPMWKQAAKYLLVQS